MSFPQERHEEALASVQAVVQELEAAKGALRETVEARTRQVAELEASSRTLEERIRELEEAAGKASCAWGGARNYRHGQVDGLWTTSSACIVPHGSPASSPHQLLRPCNTTLIHPFVSSRSPGELQACNAAAQDKIALLEQTAEEEAAAAQQATSELQRAHEEATAAAAAAHQQAQEALQKQLQEAKARRALAGLDPRACHV